MNIKMSESDKYFPISGVKHLLEEFKNIPKRTFFADFFIDYNPSWRELRYKIILASLKKAFPKKSPPLLNILHSTKGSYKKRYVDFIKAFRALYCKLFNDPLLLETLHRVGQHLFLRIEYQAFTAHLLDNMEKSGGACSQHSLLEANFIGHFEKTWHSLQKAPLSLKTSWIKMAWQFLSGQLNINFDPFCQENTPYHLFSMEKTLFIRMATPTHEGPFSLLTRKAYVNEEFHAFLEGYLFEKKKHLYINLQNSTLGAPGNDESPRCQALENLSLHYPENFIIITLNKNGSLWHQDGLFLTLDNSRAFKDALIKILLGKKGGYNFSCHINLSRLQQLINLIHEEFFALKATLCLQERKDFIELLYTHIIEYLIETLQPHSVNITCKDGIDRAATSSALYFLYKHLKRRGSLSPLDITHLKNILFAPALLVKKRPPTYERFRRFQSAAKLFLNHYSMRQP